MFATIASAEDVLVLFSLNTSGYNEVLGTARVAAGNATARVVNMADTLEIDLPQLVYSTRAKVVLAFGDKAYRMAISSVQRTQVYGVMVSEQNISTISYVPPPERYLAALKKIGRKRVAVIYSAQMSDYVSNAIELAKQYDITLVHRSTSSPAEALEYLTAIKADIDALWMVPDTNVVTADSAKIMIYTAQEFGIPVIAFSKKYLEYGAAVVIEPDRELIGQMIGEQIRNVLEGAGFSPTNRSPYREIYNAEVLNRLGLPNNDHRVSVLLEPKVLIEKKE